jgi:N-acetylmuramoyl-L-alanine amidase
MRVRTILLIVAALVVALLSAGPAAAATVTVRPGDTLGAIAARAGTSADALARANGIADPNRVIAGARLTIPGARASTTPSRGRHTVRPGESLGAIAARHGVSVARLAAANGIANPNRVVAGARLRIPGAGGGTGAPAAPTGAAGSVVVRPGDTLGVIAARHGTSAGALAAANGIADPNRVRAGRRLRLPGGGSASSGATSARAASRHTVRPGESLSAIAARYGASVRGIARLNGLRNVNLIRAGQRLRVPGGGALPGPSSTGFLVRGSAAAPTVSREEVRRLIDQHAARHGVDPALARAIAWQESGFQQQVVSSAGARGVMQLMPDTARWAGDDLLGRSIDARDAADNIEAGVAFLAWLDRRAGGTQRMIAAYYQGLASVRRRGLYDDTKAYVSSVLALRGRV